MTNKPLKLADLLNRIDPVWVEVPVSEINPEGGYYALCKTGYIIPPSGVRWKAEELYTHGWTFLDHRPGVDDLQKPLTKDEIFGTILCTPCWIETKPKGAFGVSQFVPDVLDRDSTGSFGKIQSAHRSRTKYYYKDDYNKSWRCWAEYPTEEEQENAKWED